MLLNKCMVQPCSGHNILIEITMEWRRYHSKKKKVKTIRNFGLYEARIQKLMLLKEICLLEVMTALCKKKYMVKKRLDFGRRLDIFPENKYINSD